jgi:hypothetical protein
MIAFFDRNPVRFTLVLPLITKAVEGMMGQLKHNDRLLPARAKTCRLLMSN